MSAPRRLAFARARAPVTVAMRVAAAALAAIDPRASGRRSVFIGPRNVRRVGVRDTTIARAFVPARGCEDLH